MSMIEAGVGARIDNLKSEFTVLKVIGGFVVSLVLAMFLKLFLH